jgi:hypothetical protein
MYSSQIAIPLPVSIGKNDHTNSLRLVTSAASGHVITNLNAYFTGDHGYSYTAAARSLLYSFFSILVCSSQELLGHATSARCDNM